MNIVVDTSIIIAVITNEPHKQNLIKLTRSATLFAPESLHWEVGNALSAMFKRDRVTLSQANGAIEAYQRIPIQLVSVDINSSLEWAHRLKIYAYDAYFIECALTCKAPLLSLDQGLNRVAKVAGIKIKEIKP